MTPSGRTSPQRLLVLGGTGFVSGAVAREAVARGHDVTCVARGTGGAPPAGARLLRADRAAPGALDALRGTVFDAAVETATLALPWVRAALAAVTAAHWTFVSSISVYADTHTPGQDARTAPLRPALPDDTAAYDPARDPEPSQARYGGVKLACEAAVREAAGDDRAFVVRPGLLTGPGDDVGPFGYWPLRMARGGPTAVPPAAGETGRPLPAQLLDVRDLAAWIVDAAEQRTAGTFDAVGPAATLTDLLAETADAVGREPELVPVPEPVLAEAGVRPWTGPHSLPLWPPRELYGALARNPGPSADAGLRTRPVADTARAVLDDRLGRAAGRRPPAGLTPVEEAALLRRLGL
ncbi:NAD-dependent epimerase/dehydratase family protein [Streptomyces sp. URMC 126]|uniref:NAD-dependent epimerase/dehydratase family protein n=1 Tax=Streptomyces sp. URMC 126 TaxID=3423401 RepID=UPI003F1A8D61